LRACGRIGIACQKCEHSIAAVTGMIGPQSRFLNRKIRLVRSRGSTARPFW
jgi:hypothetical protein